MGLEMIETINHIRKDYTFLNMRIGIHTVYLFNKKAIFFNYALKREKLLEVFQELMLLDMMCMEGILESLIKWNQVGNLGKL